MIAKSGIIQVGGVELIPLDSIPEFLVKQLNHQRTLLGYDFFTYIPENGILPAMELSGDFSGLSFSEEEKIGLVITRVLNKDLLMEYYSGITRDDIVIYREEGLKYLAGKPSNVIIGCEFVY